MTVVTELVGHLLDGREVFVPYAAAGHHDRHDPAASPVVARLVAEGPAHPYNGCRTVVVELADGRVWIIVADRLAHERACDTCAPVWARLDERLDEIPADAMLGAVATVETSRGPAQLFVDVDDLVDAGLAWGQDDEEAEP